jgi:ubiquinone/menaquinone biosynthesis C-methylase UbiE
MNDKKRLQDSQQYWDNMASSFDDEPDHGLHDPVILETWSQFLSASLPITPITALDMGCGTGSLSVVLAGLGHTVTGIDVSPAMISLARMKAEALGYPIEFHVMDAASPQLPSEQFDALICRHLLWTLPEPKEVLKRWAGLLKPKGRLILIEGYWGTGAGLHANQIIEILPNSFEMFWLQNLSDHANFWGRDVSDERYTIIADKRQEPGSLKSALEGLDNSDPSDV